MILLAVLSACFAIGSAGARVSAQVVARSTVTALSPRTATTCAFAAARTKTRLRPRLHLAAPDGSNVPAREAAALRAACSAPIDSVAVSGGRALWLTSTSGKVVDWQLWTATTTKRTPRLLQFVTRAADRSEADPHRLGGRRASSVCARHAPSRCVKSNGSTGVHVACAPSPVVALAASAGRVAVAPRRSAVTVLDARGKIVSVDLYASDVTAVGVGDEGPARPARLRRSSCGARPMRTSSR